MRRFLRPILRRPLPRRVAIGSSHLTLGLRNSRHWKAIILRFGPPPGKSCWRAETRHRIIGYTPRPPPRTFYAPTAAAPRPDRPLGCRPRPRRGLEHRQGRRALPPARRRRQTLVAAARRRRRQGRGRR